MAKYSLIILCSQNMMGISCSLTLLDEHKIRIGIKFKLYGNLRENGTYKTPRKTCKNMFSLYYFKTFLMDNLEVFFI